METRFTRARSSVSSSAGASAGSASAKRRDEAADDSSGREKRRRQTAVDVTVEDFQQLGAELMNREVPNKLTGDGEGPLWEKFEYRWAAHFHAEPEVCVDVWNRLQEDFDDDDLMESQAQPEHLLWALLFLKTYETEPVLTGICGGIHEDTLRKWVWFILFRTSCLEDQVVSISKLQHNKINISYCRISLYSFIYSID